MKRNLLLLISALLIMGASCYAQDGPKAGGKPNEKVVIAYVFPRGDAPLPDPTYLTHINYAFGHVNDTFDGVRLNDAKMLKKISKLKKRYPHLKVLVSIGGWGSGNFSEMAADPVKRMAFAKACKKLCRKYKLDGIDIDWEYPTQSTAKISSRPDDTENYTLMMRDLRAALGPDKLLTHATVCSGKFIDHKAVAPYIDYTNVMTYDLGNAPYLNTPLYQSERVDPEQMSVHEGIRAHIAAGIDPDKLVMGLAFYGHGIKGFKRPADLTKVHETPGYKYNWDEKAMVPYLTDEKTGEFVYGYENLESLKIKCEYILEHGLKGAMYWQYYGDNEAGDMRRTVYQTLNAE